MKHGRLRAALLAGAASLSLTAAVSADEYSRFIVFGDRTLDAGQYVDSDAVFATTVRGDGRRRFANRRPDGNYGYPYSDLVSEHLGFGATSPSQATTLEGIETPPAGLNYAASFNEAAEVLNSITGANYWISRADYRRGDDEVSIPGEVRPGFLVDPERNGWAADSIVLLNGGTRDIRFLANIERDLAGGINLPQSNIVSDPAQVNGIAGNAANAIADGADALLGAGAGLVIVPTIADVGNIPETQGDVGLLDEADQALIARQNEYDAADAAANAAESQAATAATIEQAARDQAQIRQDLLDAALADPTSSQALIDNLQTQLDTALAQVDTTAANTVALTATAAERRAEADALALTPHEIELRTQVDAAIADPTIFVTSRSAGTDAYNAQLESRLRGIPNVLLIDQNGLFEAVIADPAQFGLDASIDQGNSCDESTNLYPCDQADSGVSVGDQLFASGIDLTETGHALAADQITGIVDAPVKVSGAPFAAIDAGRAAARAGRAQVVPERIRRAGWAPFVSASAGKSLFESSSGEDDQDVKAYSGTVGVTVAPVAGLAVGVAGTFGYLDDLGKDSGIGYRGDTVIGTVFAGAEFGRVFANASASYGEVEFDDIDRNTPIGAAVITNTGSTEGEFYGGGIEAGVRAITYEDRVAFGPIASVEHWSADVDGYAERGWQATAVQYEDFEGRSTRGGGGFFLEGGDLENPELPIVARIKGLYVHEFDGDGAPVTAALVSNPGGTFTRTGRNGGDHGFNLGIQVTAKIGGLIGSVGYDGRFGDSASHSGHVDVSVPFN